MGFLVVQEFRDILIYLKVLARSALATGLLHAWAEQGMSAVTVQSLAAQASNALEIESES